MRTVVRAYVSDLLRDRRSRLSSLPVTVSGDSCLYISIAHKRSRRINYAERSVSSGPPPAPTTMMSKVDIFWRNHYQKDVLLFM